jgi:hypothetical protein
VQCQFRTASAAACCKIAGPLTTRKSLIVPAFEMVASSSTVPPTRADLSIVG